MTEQEFKAISERYHAGFKLEREMNDIRSIITEIGKHGICVTISNRSHGELSQLLDARLLETIAGTITLALEGKLKTLIEQYEQL